MRISNHSALSIRLAAVAVFVGMALAIGAGSTSALAAESGASSHSDSEVKVVKTIKVPKVVGKSGDKAKKALASAGLKAKFLAPKGSSVWLAANWKVKSQSPKAGTKAKVGTVIKLKVVKRAISVATSPAVDPALTAEFESELKAQMGVKSSFAELCTDPTLWGCYVNGFTQPVPNTIVVTLQIPNDADARVMGARAATAMFSLVGTKLTSLKFVQVVATDGSSLKIAARSEVPLLNQ
ncbi:PASTA domain-containing protein [Glaciihabitans sp. UYNi722]|uniref:PASTA domain-containing protein n=1 Tax=Glaciihabitans sp. UYNi722 TaxID=3156344 RepID=UPI003399279A